MSLQATELKYMSNKDIIQKIGPLFTKDQKKTGVLASVSFAQFILESGYGKTELGQNANNMFGMKCNLSNNTWPGSIWKCQKYVKETKEQKADGSYEIITADFRKYSCIEESIEDHSAYLIGARNGAKLRYAGLRGCTDYRTAVQIIRNGGYATSLTYVEKICKIIEQWNLTQFDVKPKSEAKPVTWYRVRKLWKDSSTQLGAYKILDNAKKCADENPGYAVFSDTGEILYEKVPFLVKISTSGTYIRGGAGTNCAKHKTITRGTYTIVETRTGTGSDSGWGRLKSGAGWIPLDGLNRVY